MGNELTADRFFTLVGFERARTLEDFRADAKILWKDEGFRASQEEAFRLLAAAGKDDADDRLDQSDFDAVTLNRPESRTTLARLIEGDPEYKTDIIARGSLSQGQRESAPDIGRDGIPPVAYGRLMTYTDLALRQLGFGLPIDGIYDQTTVTATQVFQSRVGLKKGRDGSFIDRSTLGSIVRRLETPREELIAALETLALSGEARFLVAANPKEDAPAKFQRPIVRALQFLYPEQVSPWADPADRGLLQNVATFVNRKYGANLIGPLTIRKIIADLRMAPVGPVTDP